MTKKITSGYTDFFRLVGMYLYEGNDLVKELVPPHSLPYGYIPSTSLYRHQKVGIWYLAKTNYYGIFDKPGLGKTIQLLYACLALKQADKLDCIVLVCKKSHGRVWHSSNPEDDAQIQLHAPGTTVFSCLELTPSERRERWPQDKDVYIINYELLARNYVRAKKGQTRTPDASVYRLHDRVLARGPEIGNLLHLLTTRRCALILDESHAIKSPKANTTKVLHGLAPYARYRYICTGTPVAEHPDDLWSQIYFLDQGKLLGKSYWQFVAKYANFVEHRGRRWIQSYRNLGQLRKQVKTISIARTKEECLDLPAKVFKKDFLYPEAKQAQLLANIKNEMMMGLRAMKEGHLNLGAGPFAGAMQKMLRASAMPCTIAGNCDKSVKMDELLTVLEGLNSDQLIVWTLHHDVTEAVAQELNRKKITAEFYHGGVPFVIRNDRLARFKRKNFRVLVATQGSLREAVTLTNTTYAYYMQLGWELTNWLQSIDRLHRIGTTGTVTIYTPIVVGSLDNYIRKALEKKEMESIEATERSVPFSVDVQSLLKYLSEEK